MSLSRHRNPYLSQIIHLTPSSIEIWNKCSRQYRSRYLLHLPATDRSESSHVGITVHSLLEQIHRTGDCSDAAERDSLARNADAERSETIRGYLDRHVSRCPRTADWVDHEVELARFHRTPTPMWMVTGKIDAIWCHNGVLDARDYKTGHVHVDHVGDDLPARVQAFLLAPMAAERGLRLRISYENLEVSAAEDPVPFEPEPDDLELIESELSEVARDIADEVQFAGVNRLDECRYCEYQSICPDSAVAAPAAGA